MKVASGEGRSKEVPIRGVASEMGVVWVWVVSSVEQH